MVPESLYISTPNKTFAQKPTAQAQWHAKSFLPEKVKAAVAKETTVVISLRMYILETYSVADPTHMDTSTIVRNGFSI